MRCGVGCARFMCAVRCDEVARLPRHRECTSSAEGVVGACDAMINHRGTRVSSHRFLFKPLIMFSPIINILEHGVIFSREIIHEVDRIASATICICVLLLSGHRSHSVPHPPPQCFTVPVQEDQQVAQCNTPADKRRVHERELDPGFIHRRLEPVKT